MQETFISQAVIREIKFAEICPILPIISTDLCQFYDTLLLNISQQVIAAGQGRNVLSAA